MPAFSGGNFSSKTVSGLHQFDPALGVLSGIEFKVVNSYDVDITYDTEVSRPNRPHDLNVRIPFQISLSVPTASGGGSLFATATNSVSFTCSAGPFQSPCTDNNNPQNAVDSYLRTDDATQRLIDNNQFSLFVGTGDIDFLGLEFFQFDQGVQFLSSRNIDTSWLDIDSFFNMGPVDISVTYTYSAVPLPAAFWLFGTALIGIARIKRHTI